MAEVAAGRSRTLRPTITFVEDTPSRRPRKKPGRDPHLYDVSTRPKAVLCERLWTLVVHFDDSTAGVRLLRLQLDSLSHSLDVTREVTKRERTAGRVTFDIPPTAAGIANLQVTAYDETGRKDYLARTIDVLHNPAEVIFFPTGRSLRIADGAAQLKPDGSFHCNSGFRFVNGERERITLDRTVEWRVIRRSREELARGTFDYGSPIVLEPLSVWDGWWFNFVFARGNVVNDALRAGDWIRTEWRFRDLARPEPVTDDLTWRALKTVSVNIVRVGAERFTTAERTRVFDSLRNIAGSIFQSIGMDIGTIETWHISTRDAGGYLTIDDVKEAQNLTNDWSVPNDALDMFVVRSFVGATAGWSPIPGWCDKNALFGNSGLVVEVQTFGPLLGVVMAHEMGHYLGLDHSNAANNVMSRTALSTNTLLSLGQRAMMESHCFARFLE